MSLVLHVRNTVTMILHEEYLSKDTNIPIMTMRMTTNRQRQRKIFMMVKKFTTMIGSSKRIIVIVMERPPTQYDARYKSSNLKT